MINSVIGPLRDQLRPADLLFNVIIFRCFLTWEKSMQHICADSDGSCQPFTASTFDPGDFEERVRRAQEDLGKLGRAPYTVHPLRHLARPEDEHTKTPQYVRLFRLIAPKMQELMDDLIAHQDSAHTFKAVSDVLVGASGQHCTFSLYQVCLDLGYAYPGIFNESEFVHVGGSPSTGAQGGIGWLFKDKGGLTDEECVRLLEQEQRPMLAAAGVSEEELVELFSGFPRPPSTRGNHGPLNLFAVEGCLCEINKKLNRAHQVNGGRGGKIYRGTGADAAHCLELDKMKEVLIQSWGPPPTVAATGKYPAATYVATAPPHTAAAAAAAAEAAAAAADDVESSPSGSSRPDEDADVEALGDEEQPSPTPQQHGSRYRGVSRVRTSWQASIHFNRKKIALGTYATEEEAAMAHDGATRRFKGAVAAMLNFPERQEAEQHLEAVGFNENRSIGVESVFATMSEGAAVLVRDGNFPDVTYPTHVTQLDPEQRQIQIHYDGWNVRYDRWLACNWLNLEPPPHRGAPPKPKPKPRTAPVKSRALQEEGPLVLAQPAAAEVVDANSFQLWAQDDDESSDDQGVEYGPVQFDSLHPGQYIELLWNGANDGLSMWHGAFVTRLSLGQRKPIVYLQYMGSDDKEALSKDDFQNPSECPGVRVIVSGPVPTPASCA